MLRKNAAVNRNSAVTKPSNQVGGHNPKGHQKSARTLVALPKWELYLCFIVWIAHSTYAFYAVWKASISYETNVDPALFRPGWHLLNGRRRDAGTFTWEFWCQFLPVSLANLVVHAVCLRMVGALIPEKTKLEKVMVIIWSAMVWFTYGWLGLTITFSIGALMLLVARWTRRSLAVWVCGCLMLWAVFQNWHNFGFNENKYQAVALILYSIYQVLHGISFCLFDIDKMDKSKKESTQSDNFASAYYAFLRYTLYTPYSWTLVVTYRDYLNQWNNFRSTRPNYASIAFMVVRIAFSAFLVEFLLHFVHIRILLSYQDILEEVDLVTLIAIGYVSAQIFHSMYVCIFGVKTAFALLDGMTPPGWPPRCISSMSLGSDMWAHFDRGQYVFMREHLFLPIARPTFSFWRRFVAGFVSFAFTWLWHGTRWNLVIRIVMNFASITVENLVKSIYRSPMVFNFINSKLSPVNVRRCRALLQALCPLWSIVAFVYFFAGENAGNMFVSRLANVTDPTSWLYLIGLGYAVAHCSIEIGARMHKNL